MARMTGFGRWWWAGGLLLTAGLVRTAGAIYLDENQNIGLRARVYSQASIRLENSQPGTVPTTKAGQLVQHRNFYNPELDAKLASYLSFMKGGPLDWLVPDDLTGRVAAWGFYDGIYDYGAGQFHDTGHLINSTFRDFNASPKRAWFLEGPDFNPAGATIDEIFPGHEVQNPHDIYATQRRINELYLSYTKGPVFVRIGRQFISWGESDTIALLDQNNPFDSTLAAPGLFEDLEESRIPLWTLRSSVALFDAFGPLSSGFVEAYWVPGDLDVNTGTLPLLTASPYSPRGKDPQSQIPNLFPGQPAIDTQFVLLDHIPKKNFEKSRYGFRAQSVVARTHTVSAWYYTHFPTAPVPRALGIAKVGNQRGGCGTAATECIFTTETFHDLVTVIGLADTFFLEPLDGIVRAEVEYFDNEPGFTPEDNLSIRKGGGLLDPINKRGSIPRTDVVRWELGFDRFFFLRFLNPTNSFVWITALVGSWNLDETSQKDFRFNGQLKEDFFRQPAGTSPTPDDFVQVKKVEAFMQTHLQTDYLHGRLQPGITLIGNIRGTYAINPSATYRWADWLLFSVNLIHIGGEYQQLGFFRDKDQLSFRATYQLN